MSIHITLDKTITYPKMGQDTVCCWKRLGVGQSEQKLPTKLKGCLDTEKRGRKLHINNCCCLVTQSCLTLCNPLDCSISVFPVFHHLPKCAQTHVHWVHDVIQHLILCHPLLLLPSVFPSIRGFSSELAICIRWPKYWSFSLSISPSNEYSELFSFRIDWFHLAVQGTLKHLL